jgi:hypothetical protein
MSPSTPFYQADGRIEPLSFIWEDGRKYLIDQVTDIRQAPSLKADGYGKYEDI